MDRVSLSASAIRQAEIRSAAKPQETGAKAQGPSFGEFLKTSLDQVSLDQVKADEAVTNFVVGRSTGLHETMISMEKAEISMRLLVQVRNKAVEAYREIMRMQV